MTLNTQHSVSRPSFIGLASHTTCGLGAGLQAPSGRRFIALLEAFRATGGTAPSDVVARLLDEPQVGNVVSLSHLIYTGQIFGFEWRGRLWIPMLQFDAGNLALRFGAQRVRSILPSTWSGWLTASWFAAPSVQLDGCSPADMLDVDLDAVLHAARSVQAPEGFATERWSHQVAARA